MGIGTMYGGSSYAGSGSAIEYGSSMAYYTTSPSYQPTKQEIADQRRRSDEYSKKEALRLKNRTLADLTDESKATIMGHVHALLTEYKFIERRKQFMSGIKWFFIFLGIAILFNFQRILAIVELLVKK